MTLRRRKRRRFARRTSGRSIKHAMMTMMMHVGNERVTVGILYDDDDDTFFRRDEDDATNF